MRRQCATDASLCNRPKQRQCAAALGLSSVCRDSVRLACTCRSSRVCQPRLTGAVRSVSDRIAGLRCVSSAAALCCRLALWWCGNGAQFHDSVLQIVLRPRDLQDERRRLRIQPVAIVPSQPGLHSCQKFGTTTPGFRLKPLPVSAHTATPLQPHSMQLSQRLTPSLTTGCQRRSAALSAPCTRRARCRLVASTVGADQQPQSVTPARQEPARSAHPAPANQPEQLNQGGTPVKVRLASNQTNKAFADLCCGCCC